LSGFEFTQNWFDMLARGAWEHLIPQIKPRRILEVGSFEGASACFLIQHLGKEQDLELHCVDTWEGGVEHQERGFNMSAVETRFKKNVEVAKASVSHKVKLVAHKGSSDICLASLLSQGKRNYFDFVYIDGSHQAPDVLCDAVLGFRLLKIGGVMAFDDYLWAESLPQGKDPLRCPKPAIDAFVNLNFRKINVLSAPLYQLYIQKISD
jgi:predicted O-methyltransferase YrrM